MIGIKKKIMLSFCIITLITILVLEGLFILLVKNYYYGFAERFLLNKAQASYDFYNKHISYYSLDEKVRDIFENIILNEEEVRIQVVDNNGRMMVDSYGFGGKKIIESYDIKEALKGEISVFKGEEGNIKESIIAVSTPLRHDEKVEAVIRYSISLEKIKINIFNMYILAMIIGIGVLGCVIFVSLILAKSIVEPINELKDAAVEMAGGNYNVRSKKISNDEIGKLSETFNYMVEEIGKSDKIKNEFISSISHELRTPLTSIQGWSDTLISGASEEEKEIGLNIIRGETQRLIKIVEELLDFSRYQRSKMEFKFEDVDIVEVINDVIDQFRVKLKEKNIDISLEISRDVKNINGDRNRLKQVFINLLENSFKFTKIGGYIKINIYGIENNIFIEVEDNGIGIEGENISKVFSKFYKENPNKPGSGLGLSICNEIIKFHGGEMMIESEKGKGTKVIIKL